MRKITILLLALCCAVVSCSTSGSGDDFEPLLLLKAESLNYKADGGAQEVEIVANVTYDMTTTANWLSCEKSEKGVKIVVDASKEAVSRSARVLIWNLKYEISKVVNVSQEAYVPTLNTTGWAEMPAVVEKANWEYGYHDKLPSNNRLRNYSFCFDKEKYCALWVAYPLHKCYIEGNGHRTDDWEYDPCCIEDKYEPNLSKSYYSQGGGMNTHSRGHHLPSADRLASDADNATTFYFTNMTPQLQSLNGGTWQTLEDDIRKNWMCSDTLYVVTGAHFAEGATYDYAWDNQGMGKACAVPTHYYKVILRTKSGESGKWVKNCSASELQCAGFWFEHKGGAPRQTMSVAEIEQKTGLTFFPNVPNAPKSTYNASDWQ